MPRASIVRKTTRNFKYASSIEAALSNLEDEIRTKVLRKAVYEGASIMHRALLLNTPVDDGVMRDAVYIAHLSRRSNATEQWYAVGVNMKKAPHWHLVEYGHLRPYVIYKNRQGEWRTDIRRPLGTPKWVPAYPFIRNTFQNTDSLAFSAMKDEMREGIALAVKRSKVSAT